MEWPRCGPTEEEELEVAKPEGLCGHTVVVLNRLVGCGLLLEFVQRLSHFASRGRVNWAQRDFLTSP